MYNRSVPIFESERFFVFYDVTPADAARYFCTKELTSPTPRLLRPSDTFSKRGGKIDTALKDTDSRRLAEKSRANDVRPYGMPKFSFSS